ncbi:MAG: 3-dehydroquinate synthase [Pseudomonadota bacterium]
MTAALAARETVRVELGDRSYDILVGPRLITESGRLIAPFLARQRLFILTDEPVWAAHGDALEAGLRAAGVAPAVRVEPPGEANKTFASLDGVLDWLLAAGAGRDDTLAAFGGGVVGDLAGLAASLMKRGMRFVQIPTTLLAQVDSSVGGKTAVNTRQGKNLVGAFYQPRLVLADTDVLKTLPEREVRAGYAEIVKYGVIDDPDFFAWMETRGPAVAALEPEAVGEAVARSCRDKARIVAEDEREAGVRALLNLGHTFGHALEAVSGFGPDLLHGEAVACGVCLAMRYSVRAGLCADEDARRVEAAMQSGGLATRLPDLPGGPYMPCDLVDKMRQDKKAKAGDVPLILARGIGRAFIQPHADLSDVQSFLESELKPE